MDLRKSFGGLGRMFVPADMVVALRKPKERTEAKMISLYAHDDNGFSDSSESNHCPSGFILNASEEQKESSC